MPAAVFVLAVVVAFPTLLLAPILAQPITGAVPRVFGSYHNLFAVDSLWNSRPINPVLGSWQIPNTAEGWVPVVSGGSYSTQLFLARVSDPPQVIWGSASKGTLNNQDRSPEINYGPVTLPHWPADVIPATGSDGHADILDETTGILHSFWVLRNPSPGFWYASMYSWTMVNGSGWPDPAHFSQGARAVGICSSAGIIRRHEVNDQLPYFQHALVMSLDFSGLSATTPFIYPATLADSGYAANRGGIPEGALLMLPANYNTSQHSSAFLRKIAETLKRYGAYVGDRNTGTPFAFYIENGSAQMYDLNHGTGWDNAVVAQLTMIQVSLRQVMSADAWVDGADQPRAPPGPDSTTNFLSMRGLWNKVGGTSTTLTGAYDSWSNAMVFPMTPVPIVMATVLMSGGVPSSINRVTGWGQVQPGVWYTFRVIATNGATIALNITTASTASPNYFYSGVMSDGQSVALRWPTNGIPLMTVTSGVGLASSARATLTLM